MVKGASAYSGSKVENDTIVSLSPFLTSFCFSLSRISTRTGCPIYALAQESARIDWVTPMAGWSTHTNHFMKAEKNCYCYSFSGCGSRTWEGQVIGHLVPKAPKDSLWRTLGCFRDFRMVTWKHETFWENASVANMEEGTSKRRRRNIPTISWPRQSIIWHAIGVWSGQERRCSWITVIGALWDRHGRGYQ